MRSPAAHDGRMTTNDPDADDRERRLTMARRLRGLRMAKEWSQELLADKAELTQGAISAYEGGHRIPRWDHLRRLARVLDVSPHYIIGPILDDPTNPKGREGVHDPDSGE